MHRSRETAPHTIDPAFLDRVEAVVDQALAADLNVILNSHHFDALDKDPAATAPWLAAVWKQVAARFAADRKSVVSGKSVSVRVAPGGRRIIKKKPIKQTIQKNNQYPKKFP